jgi:hypothetical protein
MRARNYERGSSDGGGNRIIPKDALQANVPQHGIDVALAQAALQKSDNTRKAKFAAGQIEEGRTCAGVYRFAKDMVRVLYKSPWATLARKQRAALERCLHPDQLERVYAAAKLTAGVGRDMPECLWPENLPKKPPGH